MAGDAMPAIRDAVADSGGDSRRWRGFRRAWVWMAAGFGECGAMVRR